MKLSGNFPWAIPVKMRYFGAKSEVGGSRYRYFTKCSSDKIFETFKKSQNLKCILDKSLLNKKVVFLHKNNSFLGFRTQKLILRGVLAQKPCFRHFCLDPPVFQSLLWPPHTCDIARKCLKSTGIGKRKNSESFV